MKKQMEGDNQQRRSRAKEARDEGRRASEDGVTTGASNQHRTLPNRADYEERLTSPGWGKQQPDRAAPTPKPGSVRHQASPAAPSDALPPRAENRDVTPGELDPHDERVLEALARIEGDEAPTASDLARRADLDLRDTQRALQRLIGDHDVVHELPSDGDGMGPRYRVKSR